MRRYFELIHIERILLVECTGCIVYRASAVVTVIVGHAKYFTILKLWHKWCLIVNFSILCICNASTESRVSNSARVAATHDAIALIFLCRILLPFIECKNSRFMWCFRLLLTLLLPMKVILLGSLLHSVILYPGSCLSLAYLPGNVSAPIHSILGEERLVWRRVFVRERRATLLFLIRGLLFHYE